MVITKEVETINPEQWLRHVEDSRNIFFRNPSDLLRAFEFSTNYSVFYNALVESKVKEASRYAFGNDIPKGIAVFSFGAPSRKEMFGGSDADVAVYREGTDDKELIFREKLIRSLQHFNFTKVDTPVWGTLEDINCYMNTSVTEANQVMEAQFICGDPKFRECVEQLRESAYNKDIIARNLLFQFFYFNQYYSKKACSGQLNLKYCPGGTRDLLFLMWYAQLKNGVEKQLKTTALERGLDALCADELLSEDEAKDVFKHSSAMAFIRDEVMRLAPDDADGKFTHQTALELHRKKPYLFEEPQEISRLVERSRRKIRYAKAKVWEGLCQYFTNTRSTNWSSCFKEALCRKNSAVPQNFENDEIINTVKIWNIGDVGSEESFDYMNMVSNSNSWIVLASLLSNPHVPGDILDSIIRRKGLVHGYEYFLEIVARNPNLETGTLEFILDDNSVEPRFKKPAFKLAKEIGL